MKLGIIGTGNMGTAILKGHLAAGAVPEKIRIYNDLHHRAKVIGEETGVGVCSSIGEITEECQLLLMAVKPNVISSVAGEINQALMEPKDYSKVIISIAAGITLDALESCFDFPVKVVRIMPNTPAMVGEGMNVLCKNQNVTDEEFQQVESIFAGIGRTASVTEEKMDAVVGLSGSSPAFVYLFIEALADGGVLSGLPRDLAYELAAQTVLGSAKMVLETGIHPGQLKDQVCSPGGTTIEGVKVLEEKGFRSAAMEAVIAATKKSVVLSGK